MRLLDIIGDQVDVERVRFRTVHGLLPASGPATGILEYEAAATVEGAGARLVDVDRPEAVLDVLLDQRIRGVRDQRVEPLIACGDGVGFRVSRVAIRLAAVHAAGDEDPVAGDLADFADRPRWIGKMADDAAHQNDVVGTIAVFFDPRVGVLEVEIHIFVTENAGDEAGLLEVDFAAVEGIDMCGPTVEGAETPGSLVASDVEHGLALPETVEDWRARDNPVAGGVIRGGDVGADTTEIQKVVPRGEAPYLTFDALGIHTALTPEPMILHGLMRVINDQAPGFTEDPCHSGEIFPRAHMSSQSGKRSFQISM